MRIFPSSVGLLVLILPLYALQRPQGPIAREAAYAISGVVLDDEGQPAVGVSVRALRPIYDTNGATNLMAVGRVAMTDFAGRYAISSLPPDIYLVSVEPGLAGRGAARSFAPVYYPDGTDWRSATPVNLSRAAATSINVTIPLKKMLRVAGPIYNAADPDANVSGFYVSPIDDPSTSLMRMANGARDTRTAFQIQGLPPGTYDIFPTFARPRENPRVAHVRMTVPRDLQGVTMEILPGTDVLGRIDVRTFDESAPVDLSNLKIGLLARKGELVSPPPVSVGPDGEFTLKGIAEMEYQISVTGLPVNAYVESAYLDNTDALHSWITVGRRSQRLRMTIDTAGAEITGRLVDLHRQLFPQTASLVLVPAQRKGNLPAPGFVVGPTDELGTFTVHAVPPGDYRLLAWSNPNGHPYFNEEFMKGYLGMGDVVHVYRGSRIQAEALVVDTPAN